MISQLLAMNQPGKVRKDEHIHGIPRLCQLSHLPKLVVQWTVEIAICASEKPPKVSFPRISPLNLFHPISWQNFESIHCKSMEFLDQTWGKSTSKGKKLTKLPRIPAFKQRSFFPVTALAKHLWSPAQRQCAAMLPTRFPGKIM